MIGSRNVLPGSSCIVVYEIAVIDGIRMLVEEQPGFSRFRDLRLFEPQSILCEKIMSLQVVTCAESAKE